MQFRPTAIPGLFEVQTDIHRDARGGFSRIFCQQEFDAAGTGFTPVQASLSTNLARHTLRGLHFQRPPQAEAKLVRCVAGAVFDVAVDLRPGPGFGTVVTADLSADRMNALLLPEGVAHGFLTLTEGAVVHYQMNRAHVPGHGAGLRWNDPDLCIAWPAAPAVMSDADRGWPFLRQL